MRILTVLHAPPSPGELGPARRHRHLVQQLAARHEVSVLSFGTADDERQFVAEFGPKCRRAVFVDMRRPIVVDLLVRVGALLMGRSEFRRLYRRRFQRALDALLAADRFDLVIVSTTMLGWYRLPSAIPVIGDTHNVEHDNFRRAADAGGSITRRAYYRIQWALTRREEVRFNRRFSAVLATSPRDAALIRAADPPGRVFIIPNGVELSRYRLPRRPDPATLLYTGLMSYYPNWHAAIWFIEKVLPIVHASLPHVRFAVVGAAPPQRLRRLAGENIIVTGYVRSIRPWLARAAALVVPLAIGGGTRVKVLEALASGVPVISTTVGCEGIDVTHRRSVVIADQPDAFAAAVITVLCDRSLARALSEHGIAVARQYDWNRIGEDLDSACRAVVAAASRPRHGAASALGVDLETQP